MVGEIVDNIYDELTRSSELQKEENHPEPNCYKLRAFNRALSAINKVEHPIQSLSELKSVCLSDFWSLPSLNVFSLKDQRDWPRNLQEDKLYARRLDTECP